MIVAHGDLRQTMKNLTNEEVLKPFQTKAAGTSVH